MTGVRCVQPQFTSTAKVSKPANPLKRLRHEKLKFRISDLVDSFSISHTELGIRDNKLSVHIAMQLAPTTALLLGASLFRAVASHSIQLPAHGRECFHEELHKGDKMAVTFQVGDREFGGAGNLEIDFWITNPLGGYETQQKSVSNGDFSFDARKDGKYIYCFGNEHWGASTKEVSFNVHGIVYVPESDGSQDPLDGEGKAKTCYTSSRPKKD